jgi:hypothetical protein
MAQGIVALRALEVLEIRGLSTPLDQVIPSTGLLSPRTSCLEAALATAVRFRHAETLRMALDAMNDLVRR